MALLQRIFEADEAKYLERCIADELRFGHI
jgi:hypothetical protein